ncbi:MAG: hypothetical protein ACI92G_004781 [Candidatus Pelagisphaera sp.]|jgi:hypothetical protein
MIRYFRRIRRQLFAENKFTKYLLYAVGEILLVVIGILIALGINNANEARKTRNQELHYLRNLDSDLKRNLIELNTYIGIREDSTKSAGIILGHFEGTPVTDLSVFNYHNINVQICKSFHQINNTFQERINSGNLAIISNDSIKNLLLNFELGYKKIKADEDHMRWDFEEYSYKPFFDTVDLNSLAKDYAYTASGGQSGEKGKLSKEEVETLLNNLEFKNGFVLAEFMNEMIISGYNDVKEKSLKLIDLINEELQE